MRRWAFCPPLALDRALAPSATGFLARVFDRLFDPIQIKELEMIQEGEEIREEVIDFRRNCRLLSRGQLEILGRLHRQACNYLYPYVCFI